MGRGRGTSSAGSVTRNPANVDLYQRLSSISGEKLLPTSATQITSSIEVEYDIKRDCDNSDACSNGICRCRELLNIRIESIDSKELGDDIVSHLKHTASEQGRRLADFKKKSAKRGADMLLDFAEQRVSDRETDDKYKRRYTVYGVLDNQLVKRINSLTDEDRAVIHSIVAAADFDSDDFTVKKYQGYYGEELGDTRWEEDEKFLRFIATLENFLRNTKSGDTAGIENWKLVALPKI